MVRHSHRPYEQLFARLYVDSRELPDLVCVCVHNYLLYLVYWWSGIRPDPAITIVYTCNVAILVQGSAIRGARDTRLRRALLPLVSEARLAWPFRSSSGPTTQSPPKQQQQQHQQQDQQQESLRNRHVRQMRKC